MYFETKDQKRIENMVVRANGSPEKLLQLAHQMANSITDKNKCYRRYSAAKFLQQFNVAEVFRARHLEM